MPCRTVLTSAILRAAFVLIAAPALANESLPSLTAQEHAERLGRIDARGLGGSLLVCGEQMPNEAVEVFFQLAEGEKAHVVILQADLARESEDIAGRLFQHAKKQGFATFQPQWVATRDAAEDAAVLADLADATGVWLVGGSLSDVRTKLLGTAAHRALVSLIQRGGVLAAAGPVCELFSARSEAQSEEHATLDLLPDGLIQLATKADVHGNLLAGRLADTPQTVGYEIARGAALLMHHRGVRAIGPGSVSIHLAATATCPAVRRTLEGPRGVADLTALRRLALDRLGPQFPPAEPRPPVVENGTLVIVGGGGMPAGLLERFVEWAGGEEASIAVIPISTPAPLPPTDRMAAAFKNAGAKEVAVLPGRTPEAVCDEGTLAVLRRATGIWFGGGRQWRFIDAYEGTPAAELMHAVLRRGGVIGGSSAGASIQGEYMARGNPLGSAQIMAEGYERGLGFLPGVAIDQHFTQRRRQKDLASLVERYPQLLGIGIDETTALVVQGSTAEVVGKHAVHFYDRRQAREPGQKDHESLTAGQKYDLVKRRGIE